MSRSPLTRIVLVLVSFLAAAPAWSRPTEQKRVQCFCDRLSHVEKGTQLRVMTRDSLKVEGRLIRFDFDQLTLLPIAPADTTTALTIPMRSLLQIRYRSAGKVRIEGAPVGLAGGAFLGAVFGPWVSRVLGLTSSGDTTQRCTGAAVGAFAGLAVGLVISSFFPSECRIKCR